MARTRHNVKCYNINYMPWHKCIFRSFWSYNIGLYYSITAPYLLKLSPNHSRIFQHICILHICMQIFFEIFRLISPLNETYCIISCTNVTKSDDLLAVLEPVTWFLRHYQQVAVKQAAHWTKEFFCRKEYDFLNIFKDLRNHQFSRFWSGNSILPVILCYNISSIL